MIAHHSGPSQASHLSTGHWLIRTLGDQNWLKLVSRRSLVWLIGMVALARKEWRLGIVGCSMLESTHAGLPLKPGRVGSKRWHAFACLPAGRHTIEHLSALIAVATDRERARQMSPELLAHDSHTTTGPPFTF